MALEIQARSDIIKLHNCVNKNIDSHTFRRTYILCNTNSSIYIYIYIYTHNIRILSVCSLYIASISVNVTMSACLIYKAFFLKRGNMHL